MWGFFLPNTLKFLWGDLGHTSLGKKKNMSSELSLEGSFGLKFFLEDPKEV
jgi:hypothetical protein